MVNGIEAMIAVFIFLPLLITWRNNKRTKKWQ